MAYGKVVKLQHHQPRDFNQAATLEILILDFDSLQLLTTRQIFTWLLMLSAHPIMGEIVQIQTSVKKIITKLICSSFVSFLFDLPTENTYDDLNDIQIIYIKINKILQRRSSTTCMFSSETHKNTYSL